MQVSVEATSSLGRKMTVAVPSERFEQIFSERLKRLSKTAKFPGFRPGKAPLKWVEAQFGGKIMDEVVGELIQSSFYQALNEQGLKPAGGPTIEPNQVERGQAFEYTASFEVYPEIKQLDIKGCTIERPSSQVSDADVDNTLESLRKQRQTWAPVERSAQNGDRVLIDFQGRLQGEVFEGGEAKSFPLVLGDKALIEGFEEGLIGAQAGEKRTLDVTFPGDYRNTKLAGQAVQFEVEVKEVSEAKLPPLDEDFAHLLGIQEGGLAALRKEIRDNLERELQDRIRTQVRDQVFEAVIRVNEFDVPKALLDAEIERLIQTTGANLKAQGVAADNIPTEPSLYAEQSKRRVRLGLILAEIVKTRALSADPARVRVRIEQMGASYESPEKFVAWHYAEPGRLAEIESLVLEEQAVELLLETAKVVDKPMSFEDVTRPKAV